MIEGRFALKIGVAVYKKGSLVGQLWDLVKNLTVLAILAGVAWYGYSHLNSEPSVASNATQATTFNCRQALAQLAKGYECLNSDSCGSTRVERAEMKKLEADISQFCN